MSHVVPLGLGIYKRPWVTSLSYVRAILFRHLGGWVGMGVGGRFALGSEGRAIFFLNVF